MFFYALLLQINKGQELKNFSPCLDPNFCLIKHSTRKQILNSFVNFRY